MSKPGYVNFAVDAADRDDYAARAEALGYTLSEYLRWCVRYGHRHSDALDAKPTDHLLRARRGGRSVELADALRSVEDATQAAAALSGAVAEEAGAPA